MQIRSLILISILCFGTANANSQDSCQLDITLLTCSPGEELYSLFGHTAIRVTDKTVGIDVVFNYGTFDDSNPTEFYWNFTRGLMRYALSAYPMQDFVMEYQMQNRGVIEQELNLTCSEKNKLFEALKVNIREENRFYNYYFHTDNCTTRARDIIVKNTESKVEFKNILPPKTPSYRNLIHEYLNKGGQYWSKFGIDILLGANLDKKVTNDQAMFLPDYLMLAFDTATIRSQPLVNAKPVILPTPEKEISGSWFKPEYFFSLLLILVLALQFSKSASAKRILRIFDVFFFFLLGLLGLVILTLWIIRIDDSIRNNFNLLWTLPTHLIVAPLINTKRKWVKKYVQFTFILTILLALTWFFIPQQLHWAVAPILIIIIARTFRGLPVIGYRLPVATNLEPVTGNLQPAPIHQN